MNESKYRTLLETLKKDILGGKYNSGASFPSIRALVRFRSRPVLKPHSYSVVVASAVKPAVEELRKKGSIGNDE